MLYEPANTKITDVEIIKSLRLHLNIDEGGCGECAFGGVPTDCVNYLLSASLSCIERPTSRERGAAAHTVRTVKPEIADALKECAKRCALHDSYTPTKSECLAMIDAAAYIARLSDQADDCRMANERLISSIGGYDGDSSFEQLNSILCNYGGGPRVWLETGFAIRLSKEYERLTSKLAERIRDRNAERKSVYGTWISNELPKPETKVLILCTRGRFNFVTTAIYEDGRMKSEDSLWNWDDCEFEYDEESDAYLIPEGWWEDKEFNAEDECNHPVDCKVLGWMPLPCTENGGTDDEKDED